MKINEKQIRKMVAESLKNVLKEGGDLFGTDEEGNVWSSSKETYRGIPGSTYVWHGENADPEVYWKGKSINYWDIEDSLWAEYKEYCEENDEIPNENDFENWLEEQGQDYIETKLDEFVMDLECKCNLNEGESYGWVVDANEAQEAYEFFCDYVGKEQADDAIVGTLGTEGLSDALAFLFRMYDFREWYNHKEGKEDEDEE